MSDLSKIRNVIDNATFAAIRDAIDDTTWDATDEPTPRALDAIKETVQNVMGGVM